MDGTVKQRFRVGGVSEIGQTVALSATPVPKVPTAGRAVVIELVRDPSTRDQFQIGDIIEVEVRKIPKTYKFTGQPPITINPSGLGYYWGQMPVQHAGLTKQLADEIAQAFKKVYPAGTVEIIEETAA